MVGDGRRWSKNSREINSLQQFLASISSIFTCYVQQLTDFFPATLATTSGGPPPRPKDCFSGFTLDTKSGFRIVCVGQKTAAKYESFEQKGLEEADEGIMKSIVFYKSETFVRPIPDGEKDDAEENVSEQFGQSSKNKFKKQKTTGNFSATDYLTARNESQKHGEKGGEISSFVPGWKDTGLDGRDGFSVCLDLKHFRESTAEVGWNH